MQVTFKNTPFTRKFGVEIEVSPNIHKNQIGRMLQDFEFYFGTGRSVKVTPGPSGWDATNANDYWHVKYDSTCGPKGKPHDYGWEVASFIGSTEKDLNDISCAAQYLSLMGVQTNNNCGYHLHVDIADFTPEKVAILLARWIKIEFYVMAACPARRINNPHCNFLNIRRIVQNAVYSPSGLQEFWESMAPRNLGAHENNDKRYTVNTVGYRTGQLVPEYTRKTVEFRFPESLLESRHIANWARLLLCFVDDCYNAQNPPENIQKCTSILEVLQLLGLQGNNTFFLLEEKLSETKIWFLKKIIESSNGSDYSKEAQELLDFILEI